jgi:hypothetical protein
VTEAIKHNGYLHRGMMDLLDSLPSLSSSEKENAKNLVNIFFNEVSLCGPRILDAPGNSERKLCELFVPYHHAMKNFYTLIENLFVRNVGNRRKLLSNVQVVKALPQKPSDSLCNGITTYDSCADTSTTHVSNSKNGFYKPSKSFVHVHGVKAIHVPRNCKVTVYSRINKDGVYVGAKESLSSIINGPATVCTKNVLPYVAGMKVEHHVDVFTYVHDVVKHAVDAKNGNGLLRQNGKDGLPITGPQGMKGEAGRDGRDGKTIVGPTGPTGLKGERGNDGTGLILKQFTIGQTYHHGDYVFSISSKDDHNSMYIAEKKTFVANQLPYLDLNSGNWVEFNAPRGVAGVTGASGPKGYKGDRGETIVGPKGERGERGERGNDGSGLHYKDFKIGTTYTRGDYVFSKSSKEGSSHDSMYIVEKASVVANKLPSKDLDSGNWVEFKAPQGEKGNRGEPAQGNVSSLQNEVKELKSEIKSFKKQTLADKKQYNKIMDKEIEKVAAEVESTLQKSGIPEADTINNHSKLSVQIENRQKAIGGGSNKIQRIGSIMKAKSAKTPKAEQQCKHTESGSTWMSKNLATMKQTYCTGYKHLDLSSTEIKNIAIHYLKNDIDYDDKKMFSLKQSLRYLVTDNSCPAAPLFTAKDISIQQVAMDVLGTKKEWVAVVNLNTQDKNGYLQSELPYCKRKQYLIGAKVEVKAYVDTTNCCNDYHDFTTCKTYDGCENKLTKLKDKRHKHYSKDVVLTGTQYSVENSHVSRRRRLLQRHQAGC